MRKSTSHYCKPAQCPSWWAWSMLSPGALAGGWTGLRPAVQLQPSVTPGLQLIRRGGVSTAQQTCSPGCFPVPSSCLWTGKRTRRDVVVWKTRVYVSPCWPCRAMAPFGSISFHPLIPEQTLACLGSWNGTEGAVSWMQTKLDTEAGTGTPARVPGHLSPDCRALGSRGRLVD